LAITSVHRNVVSTQAHSKGSMSKEVLPS